MKLLTPGESQNVQGTIEIPERGGLNNGYTLATQLAQTIKNLDGTRPVSNGICSLWSGLDDETAKGQNQEQNSADGLASTRWERVTEPFTNGLDIVGYNYMEDLYERDHELFPERVILGSENFAVQIGYRWPFIQKLPYAIGDFTWTAWDYIGEAGWKSRIRRSRSSRSKKSVVLNAFSWFTLSVENCKRCRF